MMLPKQKVYISNLKKKIVFSIVGLIHGLTNSGGTLLSLFISFSEKNFKINSRYIITFLFNFGVYSIGFISVYILG